MLPLYYQGIEEIKNEDYKKSADSFQKALEIWPGELENIKENVSLDSICIEIILSDLDTE